jgi:hypothetical protein
MTHMTHTLDRRDFTIRTVMALLSGVTITISGCGGGSSDNPNNPDPVLNPGDKAGNISGNHGHTAVITSAQVTTAGAVTLNIRGNADHAHTVSLTSTEVVSIGAGQRVSKTSSNEDSHDHSVTFN